MHAENYYEAHGPNGERVRVKRDRVVTPGAVIWPRDFEFEGMEAPKPREPMPRWICLFIQEIQQDIQRMLQRTRETG